MLSKCMNPSCSQPFRYLSVGRLFTLEVPARVSGSRGTLERFWLCTRCSAELTVVLKNGQATVEPRLLKIRPRERAGQPDEQELLLA